MKSKIVLLVVWFLPVAAQHKDPMITELHFNVLEVIKNSDNVPSLRSDEFNAIKDGIVECWNELVEKGVLEVTGADIEVRSYFVA